MLKSIKSRVLALSLFGLMVACQPQTKETLTHIQDNKYDFASGVHAVVDYVTDGNRTFIILNVKNPKRTKLEVWLDQTYLSVGAETSRKKRLSVSTKSEIKQTVKAPVLEKGVKELIVFEIFDSQGNVLFTTEPIENDYGYANNDDTTVPTGNSVFLEHITIDNTPKDVFKPEPVEPVIDVEHGIVNVDIIDSDTYSDGYPEMVIEPKAEVVVKFTEPVKVEEPKPVKPKKQTKVVKVEKPKTITPKDIGSMGNMFMPFDEALEALEAGLIDAEEPVEKGVMKKRSGGVLKVTYSSSEPF